jgi:hypothetical protein
VIPLADVSAALLACGDYSQRRRGGRFQFASNSKKDALRQMFVNAGGTASVATKATLMGMLDGLSDANGAQVLDGLRAMVDRYLAGQEHLQRFDWRYYLVKYPEMREGDSGIYVRSEEGRGFGLCMMYKERMSSYYRDPYLFALFKRSGALPDQEIEDPWHTGYDTEVRWLNFMNSGIRLTCRWDGFALTGPPDELGRTDLAPIFAKHQVDSTTWFLPIPQETIGEAVYDLQDRVLVGSSLVRDLLSVLRQG